MTSRVRLVIGLASCLALSPVAAAFAQAPTRSSGSTEITGDARRQIVASHAGLPLSFEANHGQTDGRVRFLSRGNGYTLFLTPNAAVLSLRRPADRDGLPAEQDVVRLHLLGAHPNPQVSGDHALPGP